VGSVAEHRDEHVRDFLSHDAVAAVVAVAVGNEQVRALEGRELVAETFSDREERQPVLRGEGLLGVFDLGLVEWVREDDDLGPVGLRDVQDQLEMSGQRLAQLRLIFSVTIRAVSMLGAIR
jgi:hypothetical protein